MTQEHILCICSYMQTVYTDSMSVFLSFIIKKIAELHLVGKKFISYNEKNKH